MHAESQLGNSNNSKNGARVGAARVFCYALGSVMEGCMNSTIGFYTNIFLLQVARLSPFAVAIIMPMDRVTDAFMAPLLGYLSDNTATRFGRRRPWMFAFIPMCLLYVFLWWVPHGTPEALMIYYVGLYFMFNVCMAIYKNNYDALTSEMTTDYHESMRLVIAKTFFYTGAVAVASTVQAPYLIHESTSQSSRNAVMHNYLIAAGAIGVVSAVLSPLAIWAACERKHWRTIWDMAGSNGPISGTSYGRVVAGGETEDDEDPVSDIILERVIPDSTSAISEAAKKTPISFFFKSMWAEYRGILGDHQYLVLSGVNLLIWMTVSVLQSSLVLYLRHVLNLPDGAFQKTISELQAGVFGGLILFIFINARFSINKTFLLKLTLIVWIGVCGMLSIPNLIEVGAIGFGACIVWAMLLTQSMIPDVITHAQHSRMSGVRRDASYVALFAVFQKLGIGLSLAVVNVALGTAGFESNKTEQPPAVARALAGLFQLFPPAMLALALCILTQYTVTSDAYRRTQHGVEAPQTELEFLDI